MSLFTLLQSLIGVINPPIIKRVKVIPNPADPTAPVPIKSAPAGQGQDLISILTHLADTFLNVDVNNIKKGWVRLAGPGYLGRNNEVYYGPIINDRDRDQAWIEFTHCQEVTPGPEPVTDINMMLKLNADKTVTGKWS